MTTDFEPGFVLRDPHQPMNPWPAGGDGRGGKPTIRRSLAEGILGCRDFRMEESEALSFGEAFHTFAATWNLACFDRKVEGLDAAVWGPWLVEAWGLHPGQDQSRREEFYRLCGSFADGHMGNPGRTVAIERQTTIDVGWAFLTCRIDKIERSDEGDPDEAPTREDVIDYKTERAPMNHDFQARWYCAARALEVPSLQTVRFQVDPVRRGLPDPEEFERAYLLAWWEDTTELLRRRWLQPPGNPRGGSQCVECLSRYECAKATAVARVLPETVDQADELFEEVLRQTAGAAAGKEALARFYQDREPRPVNGLWVGHLDPLEESFEVTGSPVQVAAAVKRKGMDWRKFLKVATISNKGLQAQLEVLGLGRRVMHPPEFKWRKTAPKDGGA